MDEMKTTKKKGFLAIALISLFAGFIPGAIIRILATEMDLAIVSWIILGLGIPIIYLLVVNYTRQEDKLARLAEAVIAFVIYFFAAVLSYASLATYLLYKWFFLLNWLK